MLRTTAGTRMWCVCYVLASYISHACCNVMVVRSVRTAATHLLNEFRPVWLTWLFKFLAIYCRSDRMISQQFSRRPRKLIINYFSFVACCLVFVYMEIYCSRDWLYESINSVMAKAQWLYESIVHASLGAINGQHDSTRWNINVFLHHHTHVYSSHRRGWSICRYLCEWCTVAIMLERTLERTSSRSLVKTQRIF